MSATAKLLRDSGWEISGSDDGFYAPVSNYLKKQKISFTEGYQKENIPKNVDVIVVGKHAKLTSEENEEVKEAFDNHTSIRSFPEVLNNLSRETENIVVCGSYGKSTCAALLSWCLISAGKDPSYFIGAIPESPDSSSHIGKDKTFILEGDEYPSSNWDKTSKFLYLNAKDILLTPLAHDHVNVFSTIEEYLLPYRELIALQPREGLLVACLDGDYAEEIILPHDNKTTYALEREADWTVSNIEWGDKTSFDILNDGKKIVRLTTELLGKHNIQNILGVAALLLSKKLVTKTELQKGIETFLGIKRRLDLKSKKTSVKIYEGFGSSYHKALAAISAIKLHFPERRLVIVFEPHTFSWRNREALPWYEEIFKDAAEVFIYKPPLHGADTHKQLTLNEIVEKVKESGVSVTGFEETEEAVRKMEKDLKTDDVILLLTSGDLGGLIEDIPALAEKKFPI